MQKLADVVFTFTVVAMFAVLGCDRATSLSQSDSTSVVQNTSVAADNKHDVPVGEFKGKDLQMHIWSTPEGPRIVVREVDGTVLTQPISADEFAEAYPQLHELYANLGLAENSVRVGKSTGPVNARVIAPH